MHSPTASVSATEPPSNLRVVVAISNSSDVEWNIFRSEAAGHTDVDRVTLRRLFGNFPAAGDWFKAGEKKSPSKLLGYTVGSFSGLPRTLFGAFSYSRVRGGTGFILKALGSSSIFAMSCNCWLNSVSSDIPSDWNCWRIL